MLTRWRRLVALVFIALASALLGAALVARTVEAPDSVGLLFTFPDGAPCDGPCLFGARPGETTLDAAVQLLAQHPLTRDLIAVPDPARNGMVFGGDSLGIGLVGDSQGQLALIDVLLEPPALLHARDLPPSALKGARLDAFLAALGPPDYVEFAESGVGHMGLMYYQDRHTFIQVRREDASRLGGSDALVFMYVARQGAVVRPSMYPWSGLARVRRYFEAYFGG